MQTQERTDTEPIEYTADALWRPLTQHATAQPPLVLVAGHGCTVVDANGNEYFDAMAGLWCVNVGYGEERLIDAATRQLRQLPYTPLVRPAASMRERGNPPSARARPPIALDEWRPKARRLRTP